MPSRDEARRLAEIVENIDRAHRHIGGLSFDAFLQDEIRVDALERCLQRITEACIKIGAQRMGVIAPDQPFGDIAGLGNRLRHDYDLISHRILWNTVLFNLPGLRAACVRALAEAEDGESD